MREAKAMQLSTLAGGHASVHTAKARAVVGTMIRYSIEKGQAQDPTHEKLAMSAMLYWSAASHSWSFKRSLSTCAHVSVMYTALLSMKGLQLGFTAHSRVRQA